MLYLVRHGRTAHNENGRLLGRLDVSLDDVGVRQAESLGRCDSLHRATRVVSSPLARARHTAAALGPPVTVDDRWTEVDYGSYDGLPLPEAADLWRLWAGDLAHTPEGGESLASVGSRVREACTELWPEASVADVVVVSHVSPIKAAVAWALGVGDEICWRMFLDVASVTCVGPGHGSSVTRAGGARGPSGLPRDGLPPPALRSFNETHLRPSS